MGSFPSASYKKGQLVLYSPPNDFAVKTRKKEWYCGTIIDACPGSKHNQWLYSIRHDESVTEVCEEHLIVPFFLEGIPRREVAVVLPEFPAKVFLGMVMKIDAEGCVEVRFRDGSTETIHPSRLLEDVEAQKILGKVEQDPESMELFGDWTLGLSPTTEFVEQPEAIIDKKVLKNIDMHYPMKFRIIDGLEKVRSVDPKDLELFPVTGVANPPGSFDSRGFPTYPSYPDEELEVDSQFMRRYQRHLGKVKFATTYEIGDEFPHFGHWKTEVDCKDSLYAYVCLPSYAGLINLGEFDGEQQFISFSDVGLLGVALRIDGEYVTQNENPPHQPVNRGTERVPLMRESMQYIPGCISTYVIEPTEVSFILTFAPSPGDFEVADDMYHIKLYHQILRGPQMALKGSFDMEIVFYLATDYVTTVRPIAAGSVKVKCSSASQSKAVARLRHVRETRLPTQMGAAPTRARKYLAEDAEMAVFGMQPEGQPDANATGFTDTQGGASSLEKTFRPGQLALPGIPSEMITR